MKRVGRTRVTLLSSLRWSDCTFASCSTLLRWRSSLMQPILYTTPSAMLIRSHLNDNLNASQVLASVVISSALNSASNRSSKTSQKFATLVCSTLSIAHTNHPLLPNTLTLEQIDMPVIHRPTSQHHLMRMESRRSNRRIPRHTRESHIRHIWLGR